MIGDMWKLTETGWFIAKNVLGFLFRKSGHSRKTDWNYIVA
jgi:hypothetical protein